MFNFKHIMEATITGNQPKVEDLTRDAIAQGVEADRIIQEGFIPAMGIVGDRFGAGDIFIPEMLIAARTMKAGMALLKPLLIGKEKRTVAKVVIGTVRGDMHDIGKNLVAIMLEGAGFEVIDLGIDVPAAKFVDAVKQYQPRFLALSALLTTTMKQMNLVIEALKEAGLRQAVGVFVGGAPVSRDFAAEIGADGYGANAGHAVESMRAMLN
jgi:5-methyltetrahydrofolate--homocysteine methyltransferase